MAWTHHEKGESDTAKPALEWKPYGKRPRGRPRKRWIDVVEEDLRNMGIGTWREMVLDRDRWREVVLAAKILREL
jgi:hypothetical protein